MRGRVEKSIRNAKVDREEVSVTGVKVSRSSFRLRIEMSCAIHEP